MDGVTTPVKSGTDIAISGSRFHIPVQEESHIDPATHDHSTPSPPGTPSTHSTVSSTSTVLSTFSIPPSNDSSHVVTPLTPPSTDESKSNGSNPMQCVTIPNRENAKQFVERLQGNPGAVRRLSNSQTDGELFWFGSTNSTDGLEFDPDVRAYHNSPTPKYASKKNVNKETRQDSSEPGVPDVAGNNNDSGSELEGSTARDLRSPKKRKRGGSLALTESYPTRSPDHILSPNESAAPYQEAIIETPASSIPLLQDEVAGSPDNDVASSDNPQNVTPNKPETTTATSTTQGKECRKSARLRGLPAPAAPNVNDSDFLSGSAKSKKKTTKLNNHKIVADECEPSATSDQAPGTAAREANDNTKAAEDVDDPPIKASKKPDTDKTKSAGSLEFEQYEEMKSPTNIKISILNLILPKNKKYSPDKKRGSVYMFKLNSSEGHVKIGMSNQEYGLRVKQWVKQCKLPFEPISDPSDKEFLHYSAVEKLVHAELSNSRKKYGCEFCKRGVSSPTKNAKMNHGEWFNVTEPVALEAIERWRGWFVRQQPYGKDGTLRGIWIWKHGKLSEADTYDLKTWPILTWYDRLAYAWYRIDNYLDEEVPVLLRLSLVTHETPVIVTYLFVCGTFISSGCAIVILATFFRYSF
ncbi:hypothetical protein V494_04948 [Pseudogymnoascus sp. VKM F-4513 (FW-928)]|nr:hypothetical protein V494_04948 [Pseudogymnoascus sp. VKM F-4513 (FW-928)]